MQKYCSKTTRRRKAPLREASSRKHIVAMMEKLCCWRRMLGARPVWFTWTARSSRTLGPNLWYLILLHKGTQLYKRLSHRATNITLLLTLIQMRTARGFRATLSTILSCGSREVFLACRGSQRLIASQVAASHQREAQISITRTLVATPRQENDAASQHTKL